MRSVTAIANSAGPALAEPEFGFKCKVQINQNAILMQFMVHDSSIFIKELGDKEVRYDKTK